MLAHRHVIDVCLHWFSVLPPSHPTPSLSTQDTVTLRLTKNPDYTPSEAGSDTSMMLTSARKVWRRACACLSVITAALVVTGFCLSLWPSRVASRAPSRVWTPTVETGTWVVWQQVSVLFCRRTRGAGCWHALQLVPSFVFASCRFCVLWTCGCVLSEKALKEVRSGRRGRGLLAVCIHCPPLSPHCCYCLGRCPRRFAWFVAKPCRRTRLTSSACACPRKRQ